MLEARAVTKTYGWRGRRTVAVRGLTIDVPAGERLAVAGPNGAGKSTLLALALGAARPTSGTLLVDSRSPRAFASREGVGYLPENSPFPTHWRVRETLARLGRMEGMEGADLRRAVDRALDECGLTGRRGQRIRVLSRGLVQRLGIAQLFLSRRRLLLLDEPLAGLDAVWRERFRELLAERRRTWPDMVTLVCSHELLEIERLADRALIMREGAIAEHFDLDPDRTSTDASHRLRVSGPADLRTFIPSAVRDRGAWSVPLSAARIAGPLSRFLEAGGMIEEMTPVRRSLEQAILETAARRVPRHMRSAG